MTADRVGRASLGRGFLPGLWVGTVALVVVIDAATASAAALDSRYAAAAPYLGTHLGSFESALTPDPDDDVNFNPCDERVRDCAVHVDPHIDILLVLDADDGGRLEARFYRNETLKRQDTTLDLLGRGCGTRVGALERFDLPKGSKDAQDPLRWTARFDLTVENRACLGKLRPTSEHYLLVHGLEDPTTGQRSLQVAIDRAVVSRNYLYVKEDGVERRVRIDLDNTQGSGRRARYRVCIEDDEGEFTRCVVTDKTLKNFALPLPVPGGLAVNYTWWYDLYPNLERTRGLYALEQYLATFEPLD